MVHIFTGKKTKIHTSKPTSSPASLEIKPWPRDKSTLSLRRCFKSQKGGCIFCIFYCGPIWMNFSYQMIPTKQNGLSYPWVIQVSWYFASRFRGGIYEVRSKSRRIPLLSWPWFFVGNYGHVISSTLGILGQLDLHRPRWDSRLCRTWVPNQSSSQGRCCLHFLENSEMEQSPSKSEDPKETYLNWWRLQNL